MKKTWIALALAFCFLTAVLAAEERRPMDLVVVMDTSSSMFESFREVSEYAVGPLLGDFMRIGDTFHLISFAGAPRTEISRRIEGRGDVETIAGRLLLMYPLGPYSDVIAVLEYVARYLSDLPEIRPKTVVFVSDGEHAPPPGSAYAGLEPQAVQDRIAATAAKLKGNGWNFHYVRVPLDAERKAAAADPGAARASVADSAETAPKVREGAAAPTVAGNAKAVTGERPSSAQAAAPTAGSSDAPSASGGETGPLDISETISEQLNAPIVEWEGGDASSGTITTALGSIAVGFPEDIGKTGRSLRIPIRVRNPSPSSVYLETKEILVDGVDRMARRSFKKLSPRSEAGMLLYVNLPKDMPEGSASVLLEPLFAGSIRINPPSAQVGFQLADEPFGEFAKGLLPFFLFLLGLAIAGALAVMILFIARHLHASPNRAAAGAPVPATRRREDRKVAPAAVSGHAPERETPSAIEKKPSAASSDAELLAHFAERSAMGRSIPAALPATASESGGSAQLRPSIVREDIPYEVRNARERIMLSLFVEDQNTAIGKRNVHLLKAGHTLTLGGKRSEFLIFLVPIPHRIADLRFDGERCILIPRRPEFFPDGGGEPIVDCVGKTIRLLSEKGYELKIRFDRYRDPLESLNRFLHSIELPG